MSDKDGSSPDPFDNDDNRVESWTDREGQTNQKVVEGPDTGTHRFYDPKTGRTGQTGVIRKDGNRR